MSRFGTGEVALLHVLEVPPDVAFLGFGADAHVPGTDLEGLEEPG